MTRRGMSISVVQALALDALALIVSHYGWLHTANKVRDYEFFAPPAFYNSTTSKAGVNATGNVTSYDGTKTTLHNASLTSNVENATTPTFGIMFEHFDENESFWLRSFPRQMVPLLIILPLNYYWMLWLERTLPGRRRSDATQASKSRTNPGFGSSTASSSVTVAQILEDDAAAEEIVNAWIAKGRIHRSSLSWWNTFFKWVMDLSIGNMWRVLLHFGIDKAIVNRLTLQRMKEEFWVDFLGNLFFYVFSVDSLGSLLSFVLVPVSKRIVFLSFVNLVWAIFLHIVLSHFLPWLITRRSVQNIIQEVNEAMSYASITNTTVETAVEATERPEL